MPPFRKATRHGRSLSRGIPLAAVGIALAAGADPVGAPWRMGTALGLPAWLELGGEHRVRYETLDGQFRAGWNGGDQALAVRTSLEARVGTGPVRLIAEGLDAREYLSDAGSPVDTTRVNAMDLLQAHLLWQTGELLPHGVTTIRAGRQTLDLGSRRLVARNAYRNTVNAFTGFDALWEHEGGGGWLRAFHLLPVERRPGDAPSLGDNPIAADSESFDRQFWGAYGSWTLIPGGLFLEAYHLGLHEADAGRIPGRRLHTPGLRLLRPTAPGRWDLELEATVQWGSSGTGPGPASPRLDHRAHHYHAGMGYTFGAAGQPRIGVRYDEASGDGNPADGINGRFDTLFGARRFEFGPTGLLGAVARANLRSPEYSLSIRPLPRVRVDISHRFLWLDEARDAWSAAGVRDPSGAAGTSLGQQVEFRLRWEPLPGNLQVDAGYTRLFTGEYVDRAPNATGGGDIGHAYLEVTLGF